MQNLRKQGKSATFLICVSHFLRFKKFVIGNDTEYNFFISNYLRLKRDRKKKRKLDHRENFRIYGILFTHCSNSTLDFNDH